MLSYRERQKLEYEIKVVATNIDALERERVEAYVSAQDFRVSANKTDVAIAKMHGLDKIIREQKRKLEKLKQKCEIKK